MIYFGIANVLVANIAIPCAIVLDQTDTAAFPTIIKLGPPLCGEAYLHP